MFDFFIILLLIFQGFISNFIPIFNLLDEIVLFYLVIKSILFIFIKKEKINLSFFEIVGGYILILFYFIGIISAYYNRYNIDKGYTYLSGILTLKPFLIYYMARISLNNIKISRKSLYYIYVFLSIVLWMFFFVLLINIPLDFLPFFDIRYGLKTVSMGFTHVSELDFYVMSTMVILLFITKYLNLSIKKYISNLFPAFFLILYSGRTKGLAFFVIYVFIFIILLFIKRIKISYFILFIPIILMIAWDRIILSFFESSGIRGILYSVALNIASDFSPVGSGFGTFGSAISVRFYSPIYYQYGISNIWGLSPENSFYITDTQWASIIGETGYLGLFFYSLVIICFIMQLYKYSVDKWYRFSISSLFIYGLLSSIAEPIFMSYKGVVIFMIIPLFRAILEKKCMGD